MSYASNLSDRARKEISEAWAWYEDRLPGLGDRFTEAIFKKIKQIESEPTKGLQRKNAFREVLVKVFPYLIIYRIETKKKEIFVHSIFHTSRNPRKKYGNKK